MSGGELAGCVGLGGQEEVKEQKNLSAAGNMASFVAAMLSWLRFFGLHTETVVLSITNTPSQPGEWASVQRGAAACKPHTCKWRNNCLDQSESVMEAVFYSMYRLS